MEFFQNEKEEFFIATVLFAFMLEISLQDQVTFM